MFMTISQRPAHCRGIGFSPPAIQLRHINAAIDQHFHAAGSARLPWSARCIKPDVHPLHHVLGQMHIVVAEEDRARTCFGAADKLHPVPDHILAGLIRRMRLAGNDELHGTLWIIQQAQQALRIMQQQIGALIGGKAPRKAHGQNMFIKYIFRFVNHSGR